MWISYTQDSMGICTVRNLQVGVFNAANVLQYPPAESITLASSTPPELIDLANGQFKYRAAASKY